MPPMSHQVCISARHLVALLAFPQTGRPTSVSSGDLDGFHVSCHVISSACPLIIGLACLLSLCKKVA